MPIYEYQCLNCKIIEEFLQKMNDPDPFCPFCDSQAPMKRQISKSNFQLKGGGWSKDNYSSVKKKAEDDKKT